MVKGFPLPVSGKIKPGSLVRFVPPQGAYSQECAQRMMAGQNGMVISFCNGDYAVVTFGRGDAILCPVCYLETV